MTINFALTTAQISDAVETIKMTKPVYADMLDFYGKIFKAQEMSKSRIQIQPLQISEEILTVKARDKFSLIEIKEFLYDEIEAGKLFCVICQHAKDANPKLADDAETILNAVDNVIKPGELFSGLLAGGDALYQKLAAELKVGGSTLGFCSYNSLKPSLEMCADQLTPYLNKEEPWLKGYCPICGGPPILSILKSGGDRALICSFCWHPWSVKRVYCPFCENRDGQTQQYFYHEGEKEFRVDLGDCCKKYAKTLDSRETERMIYPPLEQISSLHLDFKAKELGYRSGIQLSMPT
ncbi:MAG: formate dehydrogenase accessory protein FdhE [Desulfobacteraceae bacterium]|jgi:FdhE protein|nr:formate dehydrogenase accessory protein FdhE [Desulfobacteraceae bacterium]